MFKSILILFALVAGLFDCSSLYSTYYGTMSQTFDVSPGPYDWFFGSNRKIQTNFDPATGEMVSSIYRQLYDGESNTIGAMTGAFNELNNFSFFSESLLNGYMEPIIGGRQPYSCEFINGYAFGIFNDIDIANPDRISNPIFTIGDARFGWDLTLWSYPSRVESSDSSSVVPNARNGTGDVVYDPENGYYYWTQAWRESLTVNMSPVSCVVGRTKTPVEPESWVWSDYKDLRFDTDNIVYNKDSDVSLIGPVHFAYAKDIYGNGTGKGIGVAVTQCYPWYALQLSYVYTGNWGLDSLGGSLIPNWNKTGLGFHHQDVSELFEWVGESLTLTDSTELGYCLDSLSSFGGTGAITIDYARIMWDISVIVTEDNIVHVLCMIFPASHEYTNCIFPWTDSGFRAGYYDIRGEITDTGVIWQNAVFIANPMVNNEGWFGSSIGGLGMEFVSDINRTLSLSYAGNGMIFASWMDRPGGREMPTDEIPGCHFRDDGFLIISLDGGATWQHDKTVSIETGDPDDPVWHLNYAANVTKTSALHEEGWTLSTHGAIGLQDTYAFAACQYADITTEIGMTYMDYRRFLKLWDVKYYTSGIEPEEISIATDFELYQNYPNPFNPSTEIKFTLGDASTVKLKIYNSNGQLVKTLFEVEKKSGLHSVLFNADEFNSGIYFYQLDVNGNTQNKKMLLVK
jgi:hypothetical protein